MRLTLLLVALLAGCANQPIPVGDIAYTHRIELVWREVKDGRIEFVCAKVVGGQANANGCHYWDGQRSHIFTSIVRQHSDLCTLGHEVAHSPKALGRFHDKDGRWIISR